MQRGLPLFCVKCKTKTDTRDSVKVQTKNGRWVSKGICSICGSKKCSFTAGRATAIKESVGANIDIHKVIGKLPRPERGWTLPNHKYTGPWNPLEKQLDENDNPLPGQEPYNQVDAIAMKHDICYRDHEDDKRGCDDKMLHELSDMKPNGLRERIDRALVKALIGTKLKLGLGKKNSKRGPTK